MKPYQLLRHIIDDKYGEWLEMGLPIEDLLLQLLYNEKMKSADLQKELAYYQDKIARIKAA